MGRIARCTPERPHDVAVNVGKCSLDIVSDQEQIEIAEIDSTVCCQPTQRVDLGPPVLRADEDTGKLLTLAV